MLYSFCWGKTFLARFDEFWPSQIARILRRANQLFRRRPHDDDLESQAQIRASIIPFEMYNYGLVLVLNEDLWTLEIAEFPPHAEPGQRIRRARRVREQKEHKTQRRLERVAARAARAAERAARAAVKAIERVAKEEGRTAKQLKKAPKPAAPKKGKDKKGEKKDAAARVSAALMQRLQPMISMLYNIAAASCENLKQTCRKLVAFGDQIEAAVCAEPLTVRQQLSRWIVPSQDVCRNANIAAWSQDTLLRGSKRERRLFFADFLPMWFDTIAPIESMFVRDGLSLFGELFLESECVS